MLQLGRVRVVTEVVLAGNIFIAIIQESAFCKWSSRIQTKVPSKHINLENLEIRIAFLVETCVRFRRPGFLDAPAWINDC